MESNILDDKVRKARILLNNLAKRYERIKSRIDIPATKDYIEKQIQKAQIYLRADAPPLPLLNKTIVELEEILKDQLERLYPGVSSKIEAQGIQLSELTNDTRAMIQDNLRELGELKQTLTMRPEIARQKPYLLSLIAQLERSYRNYLGRIHEITGEDALRRLRAEIFSLEYQRKLIRKEIDAILPRRRRRFFGGDILKYDLVCFLAVVIITLLIIWLFVGDDSPLSAKENAMAGGVFRLLLSQ